MEIFHVMNRGVDKRTIFEDDQDRARFVHDMFEFNSTERTKNTGRRQPHLDAISRRITDRKAIVDIHGWCLMGNHYHLLLSKRTEGGLSDFLKKLNGGFAKYFNEKNKRVGALFQGRTRKVGVQTDAHFLYILHYIHLNPLDFLNGAEQWRTRRISGVQKTLLYLDQYRWSSYLDYCGEKNFPSVLEQGPFRNIFKNYRRELQAYVRSMNFSDSREFLLDE